jgi:hypothetical protein
MSSFTWQAPAAQEQRLRQLLAEAAARPGRSDWYDIPALVRKLAPEGARAVVGYGSWYVDGLRKATSFADVYLIVDDYARFHRHHRLHGWMNRVLPPNVYFLWTDGPGHRDIRGKYNVIDAADLERECGPALRDVYNAGRLTKLVWIAWVRDDAARAWLVDRLLAAHLTLAPVALALLPARFAADDFSREFLGLSYRGEPRLEGWERVRALFEAHADRYRALHAVLLEAFAAATGLLSVAAGGGVQRVAHPAWADLERAARRLLARSRRRGYLRWPRIVLTEANLVDLAVNEAERKAGVRIRVTPALRRHPFLYGLPEFLRVLRERNTRERITRRRRGA